MLWFGMAYTKPQTVDEYVSAQPAATALLLQGVRAAIRRGMPAASEAIAYQIPAYRLDGRYILYFAGWKSHYAIYPLSLPLRDAFKDELAAYQVRGSTLRFSLDRPVPEDFITRLAAFRAGEGYGR
jgi:uncharacterized protein YdhG (YjbR/CyaY superfamily)